MESCPYAMRMLCDLTKQGQLQLSNFYGIELPTFASSWCFASQDDPSVCSILIPTSCFKDLCIYLLFEVDRFNYVVAGNTGVYGMDSHEKGLNSLIDKERIITNPRLYSKQPISDGRNVHAFTGRTK